MAINGSIVLATDKITLEEVIVIPSMTDKTKAT